MRITNIEQIECLPVQVYKGNPEIPADITKYTLVDYVKKQSEEIPDQTFITEIKSLDETIVINYRDFYTKVLKWANWAKENLNIKQNEVIGLIPSNDINSVISIFGILSCNCSVLFLNPHNPIIRNKKQVKKLKVKTVLISNKFSLAKYPEGSLLPSSSEFDTYEASDYSYNNQPDMDIFYFGTSGSTADSKLVAQSSINAVANAFALQRHHQLDSSTRILGCLPIYHVNGLHFTIMASMISGAHALLTSGFDAFNFPKFIEEFKPNIVSIVPSILEALLGIWRKPNFPQSFRYFVTAAAPLSVQTAKEVFEKWNKKVIQGYGLTETTNFSTLLPSNISDSLYKKYMLDVSIPSVGAPVFGNEVAILDKNGDRLPEGEIGEICMRGYNVMNGYFGNPEETKNTFWNDWFHSGDLGYFIQSECNDEKLFYITGRIKNIAKVNGESVSLEEMERYVLALPGIKDAACIYQQKKFFDEEIILVLVCENENQRPSNSFILDHLKSYFPAIVIPKHIIASSSIPRSLTGKLRRRELLEKIEV